MAIKKSCLLLLLWLFINSVNADEQRVQPWFNDSLCLQVKFFQGQPLEDLAMVEKLGVKWVREEDKWHQIEQIKGQYQPLSTALKTRLAFYKLHDIGVIFILAYENPVAYPNTIDKPFNFVNVNGFAAYAAYMTTQLKASGVKFVLELWNEPHNSVFARQAHLGGQWQGEPVSPWVDHYVKMVAATVERVKAIDAAIPIITDDDMWITHYHFLDKGLPSTLDGFAVHPYSGGRPPEIAAVTHDASWTHPYQVVDEDQSFESAVRRLVAHGEKKLGKTPNIWITEWGWRVGEQSPKGLVINENTVAAYLPRAFILAKAAGVKTTCWFSAQDIGDGPMGLKTNSGRYRPAFEAFRTLSNTLGKTHYECELQTNVPNKRAFLFRGEEDWIIAAWDTLTGHQNNTVSYSTKKISSYVPICT